MRCGAVWVLGWYGDEAEIDGRRRIWAGELCEAGIDAVRAEINSGEMRRRTEDGGREATPALRWDEHGNGISGISAARQQLQFVEAEDDGSGWVRESTAAVAGQQRRRWLGFTAKQ